MIQQETIVQIADNSGAKEALVIKVLGGSKRKTAKVGDRVIIVVKKAIPKSQVKKSEVTLGVVVRTKHKIQRNDGTTVRFDDNAVVIINNDGNPKGTRIFGPIPREMRQEQYMKIISLAQDVI
tara:strand:- start:227 stop:595 length:369 start_codon:yes stop_codon:yes gene_type:complete